MKRADNPILLWLIARAEAGYEACILNPEHTSAGAAGWWEGREEVLDEILDVCRWLDAEDAWALNLQYLRDGNKHLDWVMWREARMAEAGVL